jgi:DNA-binding IclR family transcriptional regulator
VTDQELRGSGLDVLGVSAPVWDGERQMACSIALIGFTMPLDGERLQALARRVVDAAGRVTAAIGGDAP